MEKAVEQWRQVGIKFWNRSGMLFAENKSINRREIALLTVNNLSSGA
jgi:hypothetical protein